MTQFNLRKVELLDLCDFKKMMCAELYALLTEQISQSDNISFGRNDDTLVWPHNFVEYMGNALDAYMDGGGESWILDHQEEIDAFRKLIKDVAALEQLNPVPYIALGN